MIGLGGLVFAPAQWQPEAVAEPNILGKVVYDPSSGSYFEIIRNQRGFRRWRDVRAAVNKRIYKGIRGRLAVIKTRTTHEFLQKKLGVPFDAWIGLRYHCSTGKLVWVTGEILKRGVDFEIWHSRWHYEKGYVCGAGAGGAAEVKYLAVYYVNVNGRFNWRASGPGHGMANSIAIVEYPTR